MKHIIEGFQDKRILVWGDLILDEYIYTTTGRISREAPVLVTEFESNEFRPGGAGNVVLNIKTLGAVPIPVGVIGKNADGDALKEILNQNGISSEFLVALDHYRTPKKSRILSGGDNTKKQQVLRIDSLNRNEIEEQGLQKLEAILMQLLENIDFLIISDYLCQSVNSRVFKRIRQHYPSKTVIIDSRNHLPEFEHISIATPNEPEIKRIFPGTPFNTSQDFERAGFELMKQLNARGIILKRGHKGMIVFEKDQEPVTLEIHGSPNIVDVTGAGDTVISVIGLSLASGADLVSSARLANIAGGIVVMKEGAYPIHKDELVHELI